MKVPTLIDKAFLLKNVSLFAHLDLDLLLPLADKCAVLDFQAGETIFAEGQEGSLLYVVIHGEIEVACSVRLHAHDFFGDESIFNELPRDYQAVSVSKSALLAISGSHLHTIVHESPAVGIALLYAYAKAQPCRFLRNGRGVS